MNSFSVYFQFCVCVVLLKYVFVRIYVFCSLFSSSRSGYVFHPVNGCSEFRAVYKRVYTNGTACADVAPSDITVTSEQGWYVTLSDSMMVPFKG